MNRTIRQLIAASRGMRTERLRAMLLYTTARSYIVEGRVRRKEIDLSKPDPQVPRPPHAKSRKKQKEREALDQGEFDFNQIEDDDNDEF